MMLRRWSTQLLWCRKRKRRVCTDTGVDPLRDSLLAEVGGIVSYHLSHHTLVLHLV